MSVNQTSAKKHVMYVRNPAYVFYALAATGVYSLSWLFATRPFVGGLERSVFNLFYGLPEYLTGLFTVLVIVSVVAAVVLPLVFGLVARRKDILLRTLVAMSASFLLSVLLASLWSRGAPAELLPDVVQRLGSTALGFPSSLMAAVTASVLTASLYIGSITKKWLNYGLLALGASLLFLGINLPLDVVAGYCVGLFCFSVCSLVFGSVFNPIRTEDLVRSLESGGLKKVNLKPASVDARGSTPFFGSYSEGPIFVKVYNQTNNSADWLFKLMRRVRYRRLEDEVPSLTPKRAIEHEAYLTMLARHSAGVRAPEVVGMFKVAHNSYALAIKRIDAEGLNKMNTNKITDGMLAKVWEQIIKLHEARIIHKDLRTANVMVEKSTGLPWIIDFGFSESAVDKKSFYKDTVEFIASSASLVGAQRAVTAASKSVGKDYLKQALPFMQISALSGATTTSLKQQPELLEQIREQMQKASGAIDSESKKARIKRVG